MPNHRERTFRRSSVAVCTVALLAGVAAMLAACAAPLGAPDAPSILSVRPLDRAAELGVALSASTASVDVSVDDGASWVTLPGPPAATLIVGGLENGERYSVRLRAANAAGVSEPSEAATVVPIVATYAWLGGSPTWDDVDGVAVDAEGALYVVGAHGALAQFGSHTISNAGQVDAYVFRVDGAGIVEWARGVGSPQEDRARAVAVHPGGGALVGGHFRGPVSFDATDLVPTAGTDAFVAAIDETGAWRWVHTATSTGNIFVEALTVRSDGSVVAGGRYSGTATFGSLTLPVPPGSEDGFVALLDADGTWAWVRALSGSADIAVSRVVTAGAGDAWVIGGYAGSVSIGSQTLPSIASRSAFVARIGLDGSWRWAKAIIGDSQPVIATDLALLDDGRLIVVGALKGSATIAGTPFPTDDLDPFPGEVAFMATLDDAGEAVWTSVVTGGSWQRAHAVAARDGGAVVALQVEDGVVIAGEPLVAPTGSELVLLQVDADGSHGAFARVRWAESDGTSIEVDPAAVAVLPDGGVVVAAAMQGSALVGGTVLTSTPLRSDVLVAKTTTELGW